MDTTKTREAVTDSEEEDYAVMEQEEGSSMEMDQSTSMLANRDTDADHVVNAKKRKMPTPKKQPTASSSTEQIPASKTSPLTRVKNASVINPTKFRTKQVIWYMNKEATLNAEHRNLAIMLKLNGQSVAPLN